MYVFISRTEESNSLTATEIIPSQHPTSPTFNCPSPLLPLHSSTDNKTPSYKDPNPDQASQSTSQPGQPLSTFGRFRDRSVTTKRTEEDGCMGKGNEGFALKHGQTKRFSVGEESVQRKWDSLAPIVPFQTMKEKQSGSVVWWLTSHLTLPTLL